MSALVDERILTIDGAGPSPITELWRVLRRHLQLFLLVAVCVVVPGILVIMSLPKTYTAVATVVVVPKMADPLQGGQSTGSAQDDDARTATEASMLSARDVARNVVERYGIGLSRPLPSVASRLMCDRLGLTLACPKPSPMPGIDARIDLFLGRLTVLQEPHSRVLDISFSDRDPALAAAAVNAVVSAEQTLALSHDTADLDRTAGWLDQRTLELRDRWLGAVQDANRFQVSHQLTSASSGDTNQGLSVAQVQQGSSSLLEAQARLAAAEAQETALQIARRSGDEASMAAASGDPEIGSLAAQLATAQAARAQAAGQLGARHPDLRALDGQVASARASLGAGISRALGAITSRANAARAEVTRLQSGLQTLKGSAGQEAGPLAQYGTLEQEALSARTVYETFVIRQKELAERTAILQPPVEFISHAPVPVQPSAPKRSRLVLGLVVLALAVASALVFLREHLAAGFSDIGRLRASLRLPLLSVVPRVSGRPSQMQSRVLDEPYGRVSEAMRSVLAQIALTAAPGEPAQTVLISSADAGEGKTTIALWLATVAAHHGPGVLLINGDHRGTARPRDSASRPGLTELLAGEASIDQVVQTDLQTGVRFIGAGKPSTRPFGQPEIAQLERVLSALRSEFRLIVIDSPPLMGMSDALVYARLASQTVFVCRWRDTSRAAVLDAIGRLRGAGARLSGVVLSMVDPRSAIAYGGDYGPRDVRAVRRLYGQ